MGRKKKKGKLIIVTAPSGSGKTTIVRHLLSKYEDLAFSVSATNRKRRAHEVEGKDYYFMTTRAFKKKIKEDAFVEWEEVYPGKYYGTLSAEIERIWKTGKHIIFDIDVQGALNLKKSYPKALTIFIKPPSKEILLTRLRKRKTESEESIRIRISKATEELEYQKYFDKVIINDVLEDAFRQAEDLTDNYLAGKSFIKKKETKNTA